MKSQVNTRWTRNSIIILYMLHTVYTQNLKAAKENKGQGNKRILPHWRSHMGITIFYTLQIVYFMFQR